MVWCSNCTKNVTGQRPFDGELSCNFCGKVLEEFNFSFEPTFVKNAAGQSQFAGNYVRTIQSEYSASRERMFSKAYEDMKNMKIALNVDESDETVNIALRFYKLAVERNFTRGRKTDQVQATCLYIACREKKKPVLLIDFSNYLTINVYELGAVFLQLCQLLSLDLHPIVQKPVDPSIFIPKFTKSLLPGGNSEISRTALNIIASMKRDWMQTGRKPSGLCGAALYIAALSSGIKCSKSDIVRIVHICEATLTKRLIEFENTESGSLTIEEFMVKAQELRKCTSTKQPDNGFKVSGENEVLCAHKNSGKPFAYGLCKDCYDDLMEISGGLEGGSDPPAFQRAERERIEKESAEENANLEEELNLYVSRHEKLQRTEPEGIASATTQTANDEGGSDKSHGVDDNTEAGDESDNFSDIDDMEVDGYLHNEEEKQYKKIIWEEMNREYLEEQAAKEAAAAAAKEASEANFENCPEDLRAAHELAAAAAAAVAKSRKERQQKRAAEARNSTPAQTAAEATRQMLTKKRLSSKINYDALEKLFDESAAPENPKKSRTESHSEIDTEMPSTGKKEHESKDTHKNHDLEPEDDYNEEEEDAGGEYDIGLDYEDVDKAYDYSDDYGNDGYD